MSITVQTYAIIAILFLLLISMIYKNKGSVKNHLNTGLQAYFEEGLHSVVLVDGSRGINDIEHLALLQQGILLVAQESGSHNG